MKLPLKIGSPGQTNARAWLCSFCGSRYFGQLDPVAPEELRCNVKDAATMQENTLQKKSQR